LIFCPLIPYVKKFMKVYFSSYGAAKHENYTSIISTLLCRQWAHAYYFLSVMQGSNIIHTIVRTKKHSALYTDIS